MDKVIIKEQCMTTTFFKRLQQYDYGNGSYLLKALSICLLICLNYSLRSLLIFMLPTCKRSELFYQHSFHACSPIVGSQLIRL